MPEIPPTTAMPAPAERFASLAATAMQLHSNLQSALAEPLPSSRIRGRTTGITPWDNLQVQSRVGVEQLLAVLPGMGLTEPGSTAHQAIDLLQATNKSIEQINRTALGQRHIGQGTIDLLSAARGTARQAAGLLGRTMINAGNPIPEDFRLLISREDPNANRLIGSEN